MNTGVGILFGLVLVGVVGTEMVVGSRELCDAARAISGAKDRAGQRGNVTNRIVDVSADSRSVDVPDERL